MENNNELQDLNLDEMLNELHNLMGDDVPGVEVEPDEELQQLLDKVGISRDLNTIGVDQKLAQQTFRATKDIRDKYVLSRLAWDLGFVESLF